MSMEILNTIAALEKKGVSLWAENGKLHYKAPKDALNNQEFEYIKSNKDKIIKILTQTALMQVQKSLSERYEPFPLTDIQSAYLLGRNTSFQYGGVACHIYMELEYTELDVKQAEKSWNTLIQKHEMLRVIVHETGSQKILKDTPYFEIEQYTVNNDTEKRQKLEDIRKVMGHRVYDTHKWPLFDVQIGRFPDKSILHFSIEFLIADWTSIWMLLNQFQSIYCGFEMTQSEIDFSFRDYLIAMDELKTTEGYNDDKEYWTSRIETIPSAPKVPLCRNSQQAPPLFERRTLSLAPAQWERFIQNSQRQKVTPTSAVMAAFACVIARWSVDPDFCLNLTLLNRLPLHEKIDQIVGDFTSSSLLEVHWNMNDSFICNTKKVQFQLFEDLDHRLYSGVEVLREITRTKGRQSSLMPFVFTSAIGMTSKQSSQNDLTISRKIGYGISQTPQVFLDCQAMDLDGELVVNWDIRKEIFQDDLILDMFNTFQKLLVQLSNSSLSWETDALIELPEWQKQERLAANKVESAKQEVVLHKLIYENIHRYPDKTAVSDSSTSYSYSQLGKLAGSVSHKLIELSLQEQEAVAIIMDKSAYQVVAILGILNMGGVYVPIDPKQPADRISSILEQASVQIVLSCTDTERKWPVEYETIDVDKLNPQDNSDALYEYDPRLPAYIIFTSGSTGIPKGVVVSHNAAMNTIEDINMRFTVRETDRILGLSQLSFDLSVYDIFGILSAGGSLIYPASDQLVSPFCWAELIKTHSITIWNTVPALMQMLITYLNSDEMATLNSVRLVLMSGDWIPLELPSMILDFMPTAKIVALGGATEAGIWSNYHICENNSPEWVSIPYGFPLTNQGFRVMNSQFADCPTWVPGELYITGKSLATCYINDEQTTKQHFFYHPKDGQLLYRTRDLARYLPGGEVEFLGREDNQIKIHGHRIELGEIDVALKQHDGISEAVSLFINTEKEQSIFAVVEPEHITPKDIPSFRNLLNCLEEVTNDFYKKENIDKATISKAAFALEQASLYSMLFALQKIGFFRKDKPTHPKDIGFNKHIKTEFHWLAERWIAALYTKEMIYQNSDGMYYTKEDTTMEKLQELWQKSEKLWSGSIGNPQFINYIRGCAEYLPELLNGIVDPVDLLYPDGSNKTVDAMYIGNLMSAYFNACFSKSIGWIAKNIKDRPIRILEVGGGTGATTEHVLLALADSNFEYTFTDRSAYFLPAASKKFSNNNNNNNISFQLFDMDVNYREQGYVPNCYDVILAAGVLENSEDIPFTIDQLTEMLNAGGWLLFSEPIDELAWILISQAFMMTKPKDNIRTEKAFLDESMWYNILEEHSEEILTMPGKEDDVLSLFGLEFFALRAKNNLVHLEESQLKEFLHTKLPKYMIPSEIQIVNAMKLTGNGKLDRRGMESWYLQKKKNTKRYVAASIENSADSLSINSTILCIWKNELNIDSISRTQNLYDIGADSLIIARVAGKIRDIYPEYDIAFDSILHQMLNYPTLQDLYSYIEEIAKEVSKKTNTTNGSDSFLLDLWKDELGINNINEKDNLYDLGADSLIIARVAGKVREWVSEKWEIDIEFDTVLHQLLNYPTISDLHSFLEDVLNKNANEFDSEKEFIAPAEKSNAVLTYYSNSVCSPLRVIFHAGLGTMNCFRFLIPHLQSQNMGTIVGVTIKDTGKYCSIPSENLIEALADDYTKQLLKTGVSEMQLIGYCSGGLIAVEVARRLLEAGVNIIDLPIIDTLPVIDIQDDLYLEAMFIPNLGINIGQVFGKVDLRDLDRALQLIFNKCEGTIHRNALSSVSGDDGLEHIAQFFKHLSTIEMEQRFRKYAEALSVISGKEVSYEMPMGIFNVYKQSLRGALYCPENYVGSIRYFSAKESTSFTPILATEKALKLWDDVCLGEFTTRQVDGSHLTCVEDPINAISIAQYLAEKLH